MGRYIFLEPFSIGSRLVNSQADLDSVWIGPDVAERLLDPKKGEPKIRAIDESFSFNKKAEPRHTKGLK